MYEKNEFTLAAEGALWIASPIGPVAASFEISYKTIVLNNTIENFVKLKNLWNSKNYEIWNLALFSASFHGNN